MKTYSVDSQETCTHLEFVSENDLTVSELSLLNSLKINESIFIGICEVKRVS